MIVKRHETVAAAPLRHTHWPTIPPVEWSSLVVRVSGSGNRKNSGAGLLTIILVKTDEVRIVIDEADNVM